MKTCKKCGIEKEFNEFYRASRQRDGYYRECKKCHILQIQKSKLKHFEKVKAYDRARHRLISKKDRKEYYKNNSKKANASAEEYRKNNPLANKAQIATMAAVRTGKLTRPKKCSKCNVSGVIIHGHHKDYNKPLDVIWVCQPCHGLLHCEINDQKRQAV